MSAEYADHWFPALLRKRANELNDHNGRGGVERLKDLTGESRSNLERWMGGANPPDLIKAESILAKLGGEMRRALPTYKAPGVADARRQLEAEYSSRGEPIRMGGPVAGGALQAGSQIVEGTVTFEELWRASPMHPYCARNEPFIVVPVTGNSMAPTYPDGSLIALGVYNGDKLPQLAPCVFRMGSTDEDVERTFKLYCTTEDGEVLGWPLNPEYHPVIFRRRNPVIEYVVLGVLNPRPHDVRELKTKELFTRMKGAIAKR